MSGHRDISKRKQALQKASLLAKEQLLSDLEVTKEQANKLANIILITGGVLTLGYIVLKALTGGEPVVEKKRPA